MKMPSKAFVWLCVVGAMSLGISLLGACAPAAPEATPTVEATIPPTPVDQSEYEQAWQEGVHGSTYGLGKGPNDFCSRCHSPLNWNPEASVSPAPNCVTCKFATDAELRNAPTMSFVEEADWKGITCQNCHQVDENGVASEEYAWLNPLTSTYESMNTPNELCGKCHATTAGVKFTGGRGVTHEIVLSGSAHLNYAGAYPQTARPTYCTDCHDPHSGTPKACIDCHTDATTAKHIGLNAGMLERVSCMACHDASGLDVGPHPDATMGGMFVTLVSTPSRSGGPPTTAYTVSHSIQWDVACDRCHFEDNSWELNVYTEDGQVPTE